MPLFHAVIGHNFLLMMYILWGKIELLLCFEVLSNTWSMVG